MIGSSLNVRDGGLNSRPISVSNDAPSGFWVSGNTIHWSADGQCEVRYAQSQNLVAEGGKYATLDPGCYTVVNRATGEQFDNVAVPSDLDHKTPSDDVADGDLGKQKASATSDQSGSTKEGLGSERSVSVTSSVDKLREGSHPNARIIDGTGATYNPHPPVYNPPDSVAIPGRVLLIDRDLAGFAFVGTHMFLVIIPDNPDDFEGGANSSGYKMREFTQVLEDGTEVIIDAFVIGAHNVEGDPNRLIVKQFQKDDEEATKLFFDDRDEKWWKPTLSPNATPCTLGGGVNDTDAIKGLLANIRNYHNNEERKNIPYPSDKQTVLSLFSEIGGFVNSNSLALSAIKSTGGSCLTNDVFGADVNSSNGIHGSFFKPPEDTPVENLPDENRDTNNNGIVDYKELELFRNLVHMVNRLSISSTLTETVDVSERWLLMHRKLTADR